MRRASTVGILSAFAAAFTLLACAAGETVDGEEQASTASAIVGQGKRICSWNVRRLGHDFDSKPKNIALVRKVISANCDLVAVQEVMQMSGNVVPGFDALADKLGSTYAGGRSERRSRVPTRRARTPSGMPTSGASRRSRSATA